MDWRRKCQPTTVFLPGESQGRRSLVGYRIWGHTESDTTEVTQQQQQHFSSVLQDFECLGLFSHLLNICICAIHVYFLQSLYIYFSLLVVICLVFWFACSKQVLSDSNIKVGMNWGNRISNDFNYIILIWIISIREGFRALSVNYQSNESGFVACDLGSPKEE